MIRPWKKICSIALAVLQAGLMAAVFVVEELTHQKAGVNHHLYYRRAQFNSNVLTEDVIRVLTIVIVLLLILLLVSGFRRRLYSSTWEKVFCGLTACWLAVTMGAFYLDFFRELYVYPYLMAVFAACIVMAGFQILLTRGSKPNR